MNKKLVLYVLCISSIFTIITIIINFGMNYTSEKEIQSQTLTQIEKSTLESLSEAVWNLDDDQIEQIARGLLELLGHKSKCL